VGLLCVAVGVVAAFPAAALAEPHHRIALHGSSGDDGSIELELAEGGSAALYVALGDSVAAGAGTYVDRLFPHYESTLGVTQLSNRAPTS
jgi:hypothetical protein